MPSLEINVLILVVINCYLMRGGSNVSNICHIEGYKPGSKRYNPNLGDNQKNALENLILLCPNHHKEVDNSEEYTVEMLKNIKREHEKSIDLFTNHRNDKLKV